MRLQASALGTIPVVMLGSEPGAPIDSHVVCLGTASGADRLATELTRALALETV